MDTIKVQVNLPKWLSLKLDWWQLEYKKKNLNISKADLIVKMLSEGSFDPKYDNTVVGDIRDLKQLKYLKVVPNNDGTYRILETDEFPSEANTINP